jgi:hypothetical protein
MESEHLRGREHERASQIHIAVGRRKAAQVRAADGRKDWLRPLARHLGQVLAVDHRPNITLLLWSHAGLVRLPLAISTT